MNIIAQKLKRPYIPHSTMHIFWYIYYTYPSRVMQLISCHRFTLHFGVCWAFMLSIGPEKNSIYLSFPFTIFYLSSRLSVVEKNRTRHGWRRQQMSSLLSHCYNPDNAHPRRSRWVQSWKKCYPPLSCRVSDALEQLLW